MRRPKAILLAAVLTGVLSSGCTRIHSADELTQDTRPETTPVFTDTPELNFSADGVDPYANVIQYYAEQYQKDKENDDTLLPFTYVLYDMDKDGTPELIVRTGYSEADYALYVWTTDADKQPVQVDGSGNGAHTVDQRQIVIVALHRPDRIAFGTECLAGICTDSGIDKDRHRIQVQGERSYIVVIMAFIIIAAFSCHEKAVLVGHIAKFGFRIPRIAGRLVIGTPPFQLFTGEQGLE